MLAQIADHAWHVMVQRHAIPGLEIRHARTHGHHIACWFVAQHHRRTRSHVPIGYVTAANAARLEPDQQFARPRIAGLRAILKTHLARPRIYKRSHDEVCALSASLSNCCRVQKCDYMLRPGQGQSAFVVFWVGFGITELIRGSTELWHR